jgi:hypothetical protein
MGSVKEGKNTLALGSDENDIINGTQGKVVIC